MSPFGRLPDNDDLELGLPPVEDETPGFGGEIGEPDIRSASTLASLSIDMAELDPAEQATRLAALLGDKEASTAFSSTVRQAARQQAALLYLATQKALRQRVAGNRMDSGDLIKLMTQLGKDADITPKDTAPAGTGFTLNVNLSPPPPEVVEQVDPDPLKLAGLPLKVAEDR